MDANEYWIKYKKENNLPDGFKYNGELQFGYDADSINRLNALVLCGVKKAACSTLVSYELDMISVPKKNNYYVLTDSKEQAVCIIKDVNVSIMAFNQMYWELAQKEGEDSSMEEWRESHREYFEDEAIELGTEFNDSSLIVFEEFEVVYR